MRGGPGHICFPRGGNGEIIPSRHASRRGARLGRGGAEGDRAAGLSVAKPIKGKKIPDEGSIGKDAHIGRGGGIDGENEKGWGVLEQQRDTAGRLEALASFRQFAAGMIHPLAC